MITILKKKLCDTFIAYFHNVFLNYFSTEGVLRSSWESMIFFLPLKRNLLTTSQSGTNENGSLFIIVFPDPLYTYNFNLINSKYTFSLNLW